MLPETRRDMSITRTPSSGQAARGSNDFSGMLIGPTLLPPSISKKRQPPARSEHIAAQTAIDRDDGAADVVRNRRGEKDGEHGQIFGLAIGAGRDLGRGVALAVIFRGVDRQGADAGGAVDQDIDMAEP